jgi:beta-xylosidase
VILLTLAYDDGHLKRRIFMRRVIAVGFLVLMAGAGAAVWGQGTTMKAAHGEGPAASFPAGVPVPVIRDKFTADPHAVVIGGKYYIYPTVDKENWMTTEFNVWSSEDLVNWKDEGVVLNLAGGDVSWAKIRAWAPGVVAKDGKVYMYFCGEQKIGVAVADKPEGPFKDAIGKPLVAPGPPLNLRGQMIDPCPFIDDDAEKQAYLYWGNGNLYVMKLKANMIELDGAVKTITPTWTGGGKYNEGAFVFKRKGTYYFMWSENDARDVNYMVSYGTSSSPTGPIKVDPASRVILKKDGLVVGTGHNAVINVPGTDDWFIVYHRHAVPGGSGFIRETCLSRLEFEEDAGGGPAKIKVVDVVHPAFPEGSKGERVPEGKGGTMGK